MSWHANQLKYALGISGLFSFYGVVFFLTYLLGGHFGYSLTQRIIVIALVALTLPIALVMGYIANRRSQKKAEIAAPAAADAKTGDAAAPAAPQKLTAPAGNYQEITATAEETVQFLKSSNVGNGKDAVYALPWYLIAGAPKSGKTSLVLASGLNFQNLPSQRQSEQNLIRPTRAVDWRVTSDAVFVDTAGRYQTEGVDRDEWAALLETIKKYRGQRPLDGLILTVSAEKILHSGDAEVEQMAKVLRERLDEAMQRAKVRFPVYLVFTHADAIEGFRDSFSTSQREGETLVWGATIPLEQTANAHALFDSEYDLLQTSVMKRRLMRLSAPFPPVRQLKIFNFPLHFGSARRKLGAFVSTLFRPNPFSESPFLRGFYFTAVPVNRPQARGAGAATQVGAAQTVGQSFFTQKFVRDVLLRDKDLVANFLAQRVKPPIMGWLLTALGALVIAVLLGWTTLSLIQNKQMLDTATRRGEAVLTMVKADAGKDPLAKKPDEARAEIDATEDLRKTLVDLDNYERDGAPLSMRMGLYSGGRIFHEKLLPTYFNAVEQRFKRPTVQRLENDLRKFNASQAVSNPAQLTAQEEENLGKNYDLLKAYLMLSGEYRDKADGVFLTNTLGEYWKTESKLPAENALIAQQQLEFYAKQIDRDEFPRIKLDTGLVDATRKKLQAFPAVFRYYKRKVTEISKERNDRDGDITVNSILTRNGADNAFIEGTYQVPNAFTVEGFALMDKAIKEADQQLSADDWVMGEQTQKGGFEGTEAAKLQERYFRDYADEWRKFVKGVNVKPYGEAGRSRAEIDKALQTFSSANSPMVILLKEIARQTNFSSKPKPNGWWETIKSYFESSDKPTTDGNTPVERDFRPLFTFVGGDEKPEATLVGKYTTEIERVYNRFNGLSANEIAQLTKDLANDKDTKLQLRNSETAITKLLAGFDETPAGQALADIIKRPITNLRASFGADAQTQLAKAWAEVLNKAKEAEKGFPFDDSGEADLTKLTDYLNPVNGTFSKFFKENVERYFEESGGQWKVKETSEVKNFSPEFVAYVNNAFRLREAMFGKNATPAFEYEFKLQPVTGSIIEVSIDGQKITSEGTSSTKFKFPAGSATETGAFLNFASSGDVVTTSGTPPQNTSANPPDANVNTANNSATQPKPTPNASSPQAGLTSLKFPGTWGLFKFFAAGAPQKSPAGEYVLTYKLGGKAVTAVVKPAGGDLFDRSVFTSAKAPQSLLK